MHVYVKIFIEHVLFSYYTASSAPSVPENTDRPPHPPLSLACTSAPCARSASTTIACPS